MTPSLRKELWRTPDVLGFAAHWTWIWCVFWSSLFYAEGTLLGSSAPVGAATGFAAIALEPLWVTSLLANVVTIAFLLLLSYARNPLSDVRCLPVLAAAFTALGTLAISHPSLALTGGGAWAVYLAGSLLTGVGSGIVVVLWAELLASLGSQRTVNYSVVSLLLAAVAYLVISLLPIDAAQLTVALLPLVSMGCFVHFKRSVPRPPRAMRNVRVREKPPVRMMVIAVFFGVSFGAMKGLIAPVDSEWIGVRDQLNIIAIAGGALTAFVTMSVYKMDFDHLTYQIALPLMAAGFLFLPLHEPWNVIGTAVHQFGYQYFYIVLWALWPVLAARGRVPTGWVVGWGMLSIQLGQFVGSIAASSALVFINDDLGLAMLSAGIVFVVLLIALFAMGSGSASTGWGFVKPMEEADAASDFEKAGTRLARRCHLSPREIEVFFLLAKGRNRAYIHEELVIGDETVKSHIKSIYRKTDVHSQQELIDLLERESDVEE
ncbi:LuxR family transcriptional regulator [Gordonibacter massiliensis (ex Traore et al. 2017)]|uniref:LuxR family transcriptional regulator n=1 Tax=Gordonibacter massiliensis (ex Traore et al. 2017) TaxID=1841863 RepID=A0A842JDS0_9ACTN|nr:LuxR family transcriptional regulator [Gordonibacter massiliensis (ex Traore et al. 2017)]MBC2889066.1 LuxR family transcriptional regulator [Gordonibacter massiliensis (ex Traore et al. 2017)]MBX9035153.1 LuxR family transcriptional regulator [Gordonibacter massiliensis (ex Traore et al. 2017)]